MTKLRWIRLVVIAVSGAALASSAALWSGVSPAGATSRDGLCTLLPSLCPPTTPKPTTPTAPATTTPTTATPATTAAPTTRATTATTAARRATTASRSASVGAAGLQAPAMGPADLSALGTGSDVAAPQLAGTATPITTALSPSLSGLVGATTGLPSNHSALRLALSIVVLLIAALATAQLPASRRVPRPVGDQPS